MAQATAETFELTPQQWSTLMGRLGTSYGAFDDAMAHIGPGYTYSQTYIVSSQNDDEMRSRGFAAVARGGEGALARVEVRYQRGAQSPSSFSVTTSDPRVLQEIRQLGVQSSGTKNATGLMHEIRQTRVQNMPDAAELTRMYGSVLGFMREPQIRMDEIRRIFDMTPEQPLQAAPEAPIAPNAGRDRILGDVGRALHGTQFYVTTPSSLAWMEEYNRKQSERDSTPASPPRQVELNQDRFYFGRGGGAGFMRYVEPGGASSVWIGERRQYTDFPITERNEFGRGDRAIGTLRIYGSLDRPERFEVITDNAALRSAMERARIPVRPTIESPFGTGHRPVEKV